MENRVEPKHFSFFRETAWWDRFQNTYSVHIIIGRNVDSYEYRDITNRFSFCVTGSNEAYDYLLNKFWRYLGAA